MGKETECIWPEEVINHYMNMFLGKQYFYIDKDRKIYTGYSYSEKLNGDNKGQDYGM